ncbi:extracellular solute-binding protein [Pseudoruegeria sp. SK021]|uniref:extracellular solute-binding protein n=1 Tax=Pseudoruegeria sp. SK021 TaxID=1933035 RepID=UPI000A216A84|nr:extracellular solute-binding protein [Pseudoruegeria sp. SK021]OSP56750.1 ABC transporter substrate-binding protein [Pseudoruegeria sp. SK021]
MTPPRAARAVTAPLAPLSHWGIGALLIPGLVLLASALPVKSQDADVPTVVSHGYSNFGTLKYPADAAHLDYVNPDAPKGGEISIWAQGNFDSFNQYARAGVPAALNTIGTESILTGTADDPFGAYCFLCTTLEYPEDLSWVIFNLRDDVTFQDGTPMTAEDVAFSHNLFLTQGIVEYRSLVEAYYGEVEILGPYRIKFNFKDEAPLRDRIGFAGGTPAFSKAWFEETGARLDQSTKTPFMSTGPYVLDSFDYNRRVVYARNPDYWGADIPLNVGRNNFDRIRVEYFSDSTAAFEGFKSGAYTFRNETSSQTWAQQYDFPGVEKGYVVLEDIPDGSVGTHLSWVFNLDKPKWQDPRTRQAIEMMFNFAWSNRTLFYDFYKQPASFWPGTDLAASGVPSEAEVALLQPLVNEGLLEASILTDEVAMPAQHDAERNRPARQIVRQATQLLNDAGWIAGDDGMRRKDGQLLDLVIIQRDPLYDRAINPFIENLKGIGVEGRLERVDTAQYVERRRAGTFDLANQGFQMDFEPSSGLEQWFGSKTADNSSRNLMRLRSPAVDRLIASVVAADTLDDLTSSVHALDRVMRANRFDIPLWYNDATWVAYYDMFRHPETLPPLSVGELDFWWYDAEAAAQLKSEGAL